MRLYVDGTQQEIDAPVFDRLATADLAGDRFEIRIGAPAYQAAPADDTCFHGLIGEVRLWETYLPADQISARMHTKLRGDEFSLLAFWDFDTQGVHDMARNGYDGALVPADDAARATFWLCDLSFAQPDYPDVATSAKVIQIGEDTAKAAAEAAQKLAVEIGDKVTVAIQYVDDVVNVVVNSIADAMEIVATFLEKIALLVVEFIEFLLFLFDWKAIVETHRILKHSMFHAFDYLIDGGKMGSNMARIIGEALDHIPGMGGVASAVTHEAAQVNPQDRASRVPSSNDGDGNGVAGGKILSKIIDFCTGGGAGGGDVPDKLPPQIEKVTGEASAILAMLPELITASPSEIGDKMLGVLQDIGGDLKSLLTDELKDTIGAAVPNVRAEDLDVSFHIPFVSALYEWITGDDLTLVDAMCLAMAIPLNIAYAVTTGGGHFNDDADGLADKIASLRPMSESFAMAVGSSVDPNNNYPHDHYDFLEQPVPWTMQVEKTIVIARSCQIIIAGLCDIGFNPNGQQIEGRRDLQILGGLIGGVATVLQARSFQPELCNWLIREGYEVDAKRMEQLSMLNMSVATLPLVVLAINSTVGQLGSGKSRDMTKFIATLLNALAALAAIEENLITSLELSKCDGGEADDALWLNFSSQTAQSLTTIDSFAYTQLGADLLGKNPADYVALAATNLGLRISSGALQGAAALVLGSH